MVSMVVGRRCVGTVLDGLCPSAGLARACGLPGFPGYMLACKWGIESTYLSAVLSKPFPPSRATRYFWYTNTYVHSSYVHVL